MAAPANLAMVAATTEDSRSVVVSYRVEGAGLDPGTRIDLYRSADDRFGGDDTAIGGAVLGESGPGAIAADLAGRAATAAGEHRVAIDVPGGLAIRPKQPYVLAVAGSGEAAGQVAAFRPHTIAIVTHGGNQSQGDAAHGPAWQRTMARSLRRQGYDVVLAYNWVGESRTPGRAATQGRRLGARVRQVAEQFRDGNPVDLHFIGHSEGAVVNSQAIQELHRDEPAAVRAGYLEVTMLDPHAASNGVPGAQYSVSHGLLGWIARNVINRYQSRAKDPLPVITADVDDAQVFYQHTPVSRSGGSNNGIYNLWGQVPVHGEASYFDLTGPGVSHSGRFGVPLWYQLHVVPTLGEGAPRLHADALTTALATPPDKRTRLGEPVTATTEPTYAGTAAPGSTVRIHAVADGSDAIRTVATAEAGPDGRWVATTHALPPGRYRVAATALLPIGPAWTRPMRMRPTSWPGAVIVAPRLARTSAAAGRNGRG